MSSRLAGKRGIVTGAAGGIGAAACTAFVSEGATLGLIDLPGPGLTSLAGQLASSSVAIAGDVADESSIAGAVDTFINHEVAGGRLDFVYVCAGVQLHGSDGAVADVSLETWSRTMATNLTGAFLTIKHTVGPLASSGSGSLILCGSPTGITMSGANYTAYSASKAGMMALARTVAADYAPTVRANVIVPGPTRTPLIGEILEDERSSSALLAGTPVGRFATPADLVGVAVFLASDESRYATGATFAVDGGMTVR